MNDQNNIKLLLKLINETVGRNAEIPEDIANVDWESFYELALMNKLAPLLYNSVSKNSDKYAIPKDLLTRWKRNAAESMIYESQKYIVLNKIMKLAKEQDITCVHLKGYVLADLYPNYLARISSDTDLFAYERDKEKIVKLFEGLGFKKSTISSKDTVYNYFLDSLHYMVEVHFSLWEDFQGSVIKLLDQLQLTNEEKLVRTKACGMDITTLGYEEHLIFQLYHIIKHFSLQGVGIRYLLDITLYLNRYDQYINAENFWKKMELLNYAKFCENFFYICTHYFGMSAKILEGRSFHVMKNVEVFLLDLIKIGDYDQRSADWHLIGILKPYFLGEQEIPKSKLSRKLRILFPERKSFPIEYARKHILLLPIGWIHRCIHFVIRLPKRRRELKEAKEKMTLAEARLSLMHNLGLADGGKKV